VYAVQDLLRKSAAITIPTPFVPLTRNLDRRDGFLMNALRMRESREDKAVCQCQQLDQQQTSGAVGGNTFRSSSPSIAPVSKREARLAVTQRCGHSCLNRSVYVECTPSTCSYRGQCGNRALGRGRRPAVAVRYFGAKGWGIVLQEDVTQGQLVIEYVGEVRACCEDSPPRRSGLHTFRVVTIGLI